MNSEDWKIFQENRIIPEEQKYISCFAAFNHIRIVKDGAIKPCCFSNVAQYWSKEKGLHDYWFSGLNLEYQNKFFNSELHKGCGLCKERIEKHIPVPINEYDWNVEDRMKDVVNISYPKIFEFEISNLCNMECPMCMGYLSSKHAANRDKDIYVPPNIFDDDENLDHLIKELKEFIPHLEEMRFVGGEPLAHKAMFKIAKVIYNIKPELRLTICTNGSIYNKKVEKLCKENNVHFSFSIDTVIPEEYHQIRIGGKYDSTYSNINKIKNLIGKDKIEINSTLMCINAENIIKFFQFGLNNGYKIFINTYSLQGRVNSPDWGLHLVPFDVKWKVIKQCKEYLREDNKIPFVKLPDNYIEQLKRIIKLLS